MSANDHESNANTDFGVMNEFSRVDKLANVESVNNKHWLCGQIGKSGLLNKKIIISKISSYI